MISSLPTFEQRLIEGNNTSKVWYRFWQNIWQGVPPALETILAVTASPFTYNASRKGFLIVQGGTVSLIQWSRTAGTNRTTGATQGIFPVSAGDNLIITYTVIPTVTFVPQ